MKRFRRCRRQRIQSSKHHASRGIFGADRRVFTAAAVIWASHPPAPGIVRRCGAFPALTILLCALCRSPRAAAWTLSGARRVSAPSSLRRMSASKADAAALSPDMARRAAGIVDVLDRLYPEPPVPLNHKDDFTFLCAVVLSAQTTDGKVNAVTKTLFELAPTPERLAAMDPAQLLSIVQPVGLAPQKTKYLIGLATQIVERFNGQVPRTFEELESLPGVGHKTASVVMSQCFGHAAFAVDTHVHRLALRWGLSKSNNVDRVQQDLMAIFPEDQWSKLHLQFIYMGREHCTAKEHAPSSCPICSWVNDPKGTPPADLSAFSPKKTIKNIVYYHHRREELTQDATLMPTQLSFSEQLAVQATTASDGSVLAKRTIKLEEEAVAVEATADANVSKRPRRASSKRHSY